MGALRRFGLGLLTFRIVYAAGVLKMRADPCWRTWSCFAASDGAHFQTMPMPNPLSWYVHHLPAEWLAWMQYLAIDVIELRVVQGFPAEWVLAAAAAFAGACGVTESRLRTPL